MPVMKLEGKLTEENRDLLGNALDRAQEILHAVSHLKKNKADLVILDIKMPKVDGLEVLRSIKKSNPAIKTVIATGYQSSEVAEETIRLGASDYITKPFDKKIVLKTIGNCLE